MSGASSSPGRPGSQARSQRASSGAIRVWSWRPPRRVATPARGSIASTRATECRWSWRSSTSRRAAEFDAAIVAYPHGAAAELVGELRSAGLSVVDVSADFRLHDLATYERTYGDHGAPAAARRRRLRAHRAPPRPIAGAKLVANPGCYPTAALLALAPLAEAGLADDVVISAASGVSGAGRGGGERLHFVTVDENFSPYGVDGHRHAPEIVQELGSWAPRRRCPSFRIFCRSTRACWRAATSGSHGTWGRRSSGPCTTSATPVSRSWSSVDEPPGVRDVRDTNLCRVHVSLDDAGRALVFAAIDNLWKGAAGQAIQNLNLMLGLPETEGLQ